MNPLVELPEEKMYYPDFALFNDSVFIFPDYYGQCWLFLVDRYGNIIRKTGDIPAKEYTVI